VAEQIRELVPEMRMAMAHGRLAPTTIENTMQDFVDGKFDCCCRPTSSKAGSISRTPTR